MKPKRKTRLSVGALVGKGRGIYSKPRTAFITSSRFVAFLLKINGVKIRLFLM
jgi:hypothetical protein